MHGLRFDQTYTPGMEFWPKPDSMPGMICQLNLDFMPGMELSKFYAWHEMEPGNF